jgi:hypothetical protein
MHALCDVITGKHIEYDIPDRVADLVCKHLTKQTELMGAVIVQVTIHHFLISVHLHYLTATLENFIIGSRQAL